MKAFNDNNNNNTDDDEEPPPQFDLPVNDDHKATELKICSFASTHPVLALPRGLLLCAMSNDID